MKKAYPCIFALCNYVIFASVLSLIFTFLLSDGIGYGFSKDNVFIVGILGYAKDFFSLIFIFFIPFIVSKMGFVKTYFTMVLIYILLLFLLFFNFFNISSLIVIKVLSIVLFSIITSYLLLITDTTLNVLSKNEERGRLNAVLNILFLVSTTFLLGFMQNEYILIITCGIASIISLLIMKYKIVDSHKIYFSNKLSFIKNIKEDYTLFTSKIIFEFVLIVLFVLIPSYNELELNNSTLLNVYYIINIFLSYIIGYFFDRRYITNLSMNLFLSISVFFTIVFVGMLQFIEIYYSLFFVIYCLLGILTTSIYIICISTINNSHDKEQLLSVNSNMLIVKYIVYFLTLFLINNTTYLNIVLISLFIIHYLPLLLKSFNSK